METSYNGQRYVTENEGTVKENVVLDCGEISSEIKKKFDKFATIRCIELGVMFNHLGYERNPERSKEKFDLAMKRHDTAQRILNILSTRFLKAGQQLRSYLTDDGGVQTKIVSSSGCSVQ